jgi:hypothetical protein
MLIRPTGPVTAAVHAAAAAISPCGTPLLPAGATAHASGCGSPAGGEHYVAE